MNKIVMTACAIIVGSFGICQSASAQQYNKSWQFTNQNRASIAALMQQVDRQEELDEQAANTVTAGATDYDSLVCAGAGGSSATGNSICIILNNATGDVQIGQDSQGSQNANDETNNTELGDTLSSLVD